MLFILHVLVKSHILYFEGSLNYVGIHVLWTGSWDLRLRLWEHPIRCSICGYPVGLCIALTYNWTTHLLVFNFSALNGLNKFLIDRGLLHPEVGFQLSACMLLFYFFFLDSGSWLFSAWLLVVKWTEKWDLHFPLSACSLVKCSLSDQWTHIFPFKLLSIWCQRIIRYIWFFWSICFC